MDADRRRGDASLRSELAGGADSRLARRSRWASVGLVLVLLGVSAFALLSSQSTARAVSTAAHANQLSDDYAQAAEAVAAEEALEHKYRLDPGPDVKRDFDAAAAKLLTALQLIGRDGKDKDRAITASVSAWNREYLKAVDRMFPAVANRDADQVRAADETMEPLFSKTERAVDAEAVAHHEDAQRQLANLRHRESLVARLTPIVFLVGLMLSAVLVSIMRGYRRLLHVERARAVHDSKHDALTGLPNRTMLRERFGSALQDSERTGDACALLLIDLDRFKEINDTFGHHFGDEVLIQIGPRLRGALRPDDMISRLGGDEFAVLLPRVADAAAAASIARKLRACLDAPFHVEGIGLDIEASIGVALSGRHGRDVPTLLQRADIAMYVAKAQGVGVFAYDPGLDEHNPAKLALLGDLKQALAAGELVLHYQPKTRIRDSQVVGVEALVRWNHPERGLLPPDAFLPLAERTGLIGPLTSYVLNEALAQARRWVDAGRPMTVCVNLSPRSLLDERLLEHVGKLLSLHGVPASLLLLEVTESAIMTDPLRAARLLGDLAAQGIGMAIDDFGAGYTSLGQLKSLPVTELKIDKSFVQRINDDTSDAVIVHSVVDLGHHLGLTIVAEGVESQAAFDQLAAYECDIAQGFYVSEPLPADAFDGWYRTRLAAAQPSRGGSIPALPSRRYVA